MPNILFVLFHDFTANSAYHVHSFANCLTDLGCSCAVAVPEGKQSIESIGTVHRYTCYDFAELERSPLRFADGQGADIVHCWTPREAVREFYERVPGLHKAKLFIHLEDNEWEIASRTLQLPFDKLAGFFPYPSNLSHPVHGKGFMERAAGLTLIVRTLQELVPPGKPAIELWPSADEELFGARAIDWDRRAGLGIAPHETVIVYSGSVHASNVAEVRSLYLAVAMLNREGHPARLIRTGKDHCAFLDEAWTRFHTIELGFVERAELPGVMAMANVFVQPGRPGPFNDYRFPSKIPEFCAIGRPLILPASNVALAMRHLEDAYIVPQATATAITEAVQAIRADPDLEARLTAGALRFFDERLCWRRSASKLLDFYRLLAAEGDH